MSNLNLYKLGELYDITSSKRVFQSEWKENGIPFYRAREITKLASDGYVNNELFISEEMYNDYAEKYGRPNVEDIMITGVGTLGVCYVVRDNDKFYFKDGNIIWLKHKNDKVNSNYIKWAFKSQFVIEQIERNASGTTVGTYTIANAKETIIPLPNRIIQSKIVEVLDTAQSLIDKRKQQIDECDELIKSRFVEMFGNLHNTEYKVISLEELCEFIKDGTHQTPTYTEDSVNGYKFLSSKDVTSGTINWNKIKYIPEELHNELYSKIAPKRGDILLAKNGTTGIGALVDTDEIFDIYVSLALLRFKEGNNPQYLLSAINSVDTKRQFDESLKGVGVPNLHLGEIKKTRIIVPPINLQNQFNDFVEQVYKLKLKLQLSLTELESNFNALMHKAFKGELFN